MISLSTRHSFCLQALTFVLYEVFRFLEFGFPDLLEGFCGGARGVMVIVVGNGHGDTSSNPGPG